MSNNTKGIFIMLSGRAKSGKSSVAEYLCGHYGFREVSLADALKRGCIETFGLTPDQVFTQEGKATLDTWWRVLPREILQLYGTEIFQYAWPRALKKVFKRGITRDVGRQFWCHRLWKSIAHRVEAGERLVLTDCRFPHEMSFFAPHGAISVRIDRKAVEVKRTWLQRAAHRLHLRYYPDLHVSETALDNWKFDHRLDSNGTLQELMHNVETLMRTLRVGHIVVDAVPESVFADCEDRPQRLRGAEAKRAKELQVLRRKRDAAQARMEKAQQEMYGYSDLLAAAGAPKEEDGGTLEQVLGENPWPAVAGLVKPEGEKAKKRPSSRLSVAPPVAGNGRKAARR